MAGVGAGFSEIRMDVTRLSSLYGRVFDRVVLVQEGVNTIYRTQENGRTTGYLRLFRRDGRTREDIEFELHLLEALSATRRFAVAKPIRDAHGKLLTTWVVGHEVRRACLFAVARGRELVRNVPDMKRFGAALAGLHIAADEARVPFFRSLDAPTILRDSVASLRQVGSIAEAIARRIESECEGVPLLLQRERSGVPS